MMIGGIPMSDYAVVLYFDDTTNNRLQNMIDKVAQSTGVGYMKTANVPPHVTLAMVLGENEREIANECERFASEIEGGKEVVFASIGVFNPFVIYLAPVMNDFLREANKAVNERLQKIAAPGNRGLYLPNNWVPHAAVAVKLNPETLKKAFAVVQEMFTPFTAKTDRLVLAKCDPYTELKIWDLK
jgi:2'-5' RNA ligase